MKTRRIGESEVGAIGLGCMGMSWAYGAGISQEEAATVLRRALELGVNHWDTADLYGAGENEKLLSGVLANVRDRVFLATKFGNVFDRTLTSYQDEVKGNAPWIVDGTPEYARKCIDLSLQRLNVEQIDLYYLHRIDSNIPIEETVGAMAEFVKEGKTKYIGLSEVSAETLKRAHAVHPISAVQNEFSLWTQDYRGDVLPLCAELGITFVPYSPLGRGFLTGEIKSPEDLPADDWRRENPRFQAEYFEKNLEIVRRVEAVAERHGVTTSQVALAWVLAQGEHVAPIPGTKRVKYLELNAAAADVELTPQDLAELDEIQPPAGDRYAAGSMAYLNR